MITSSESIGATPGNTIYGTDMVDTIASPTWSHNVYCYC